MKYPDELSVTAVDGKRLKGDGFPLEVYGRNLVFSAYGANAWVQFWLCRLDENKSYLLDLEKKAPNPWKDPALPHTLPSRFIYERKFDTDTFYIKVSGRPAETSFNMMQTDISITMLHWTVSTTFIDPKGICYSFQMQFDGFPDTSAEERATVMGHYYPIYKSMLASISFDYTRAHHAGTGQRGRYDPVGISKRAAGGL